MRQTLAERIYEVISQKGEPMPLSEITELISDKPTTTIRGRIYDNLGKLFKKIARGVYWIEQEEGACLVVEADGRKEGLQLFDDESVDAIICDHPYDIPAAHNGTNRSFTGEYDCFRYTLEDFKEKARVLKPGHFLIEFVPEESALNYDYLYQLKKMAEATGLNYYAKIPWKKGEFISNTGRKSKNVEDILFFTKGKPRSLRPNKSKFLRGERDAKMSGTAHMLPTAYQFESVTLPDEFDVQPPSRKTKIHQAEKPVKLFDDLLKAVTLPGEIIIDCFAGSGAFGESALKLKRIGILFEILHENILKISRRLGAHCLFKENNYETSIPNQTFTQLALF